MLARSRFAPAVGAALLLAAACARGRTATSGQAAPGLSVRPGELRSCQLLTGELFAGEAASLAVPQVPQWQVQIRWLARDGALVAAGEPVAVLDNSALAADLEDKRLKVAEAERELDRLAAEGAVGQSDKLYAVEEKRAAVEKARARADVPADLLPAAEREERQRTLARAEFELAKAERALATDRQSRQAELEIERIDLARSRREIADAERGRSSLTLTAPRAGLLVLGRHPWEGRALREGDTVWVGMPIATIPDLSTLAVLARLPDVDDGRIAVGQLATCALDADPARGLPCRVEDISPVAAEAAKGSLLRRAFAVRVALDGGADPDRMRPGMSVRVEACGAPRRGLLAPRAGIDFTSRPARARRVDGTTAPVRLGPCDPFDCLVESGLAAGARLAPVGAPGSGGEIRR